MGYKSLKIKIIETNKKKFLELLLLADEEEHMIDKYINRGIMFALDDDGIKAVCLVTKENERVYEIKNIAVYKNFQGMGYGKKLIEYVFGYFNNICDVIYVGTGDSPLTVPFYKKCGFIESHRIKNFFIENYKKPIFECNVQLIDMIYFKKILNEKS